MFFFFDDEVLCDEFAEPGFDDVSHCEFGESALGAHTSECDGDLIAFDVDELDVAAVGPKCRSDLLVYCLLDELYFLDVGELLGASRGGCRFLLYPVAPDFLYDFFDFRLAAAAAAAGLGVVGDLLGGCKVVVGGDPFDFAVGVLPFRDAEAPQLPEGV